MPLDTPTLNSELAELFEAPPSGGSPFNASAARAACGQAWADAVQLYAAGVVPVSTTVAAASVVLAGALATAFEQQPHPAAATSFDAAFAAFATAVALGQAPLFTGTPPPLALNVASLLVAPQPTRAASAAAFASLIDTWMRTGFGTLVAPPFTVVPWS